MAYTRLYISSEIGADSELQLDAGQARYIGRVLRLRPGDGLSVFNGEQGEFAATVQSVEKSSATIKVGEHIRTAAESALRMHLVQGVSRGERMDFVVQKATELGVKRITPVLTEYGVVKLDESKAPKRRHHWLKVAQSACEQSGRIRPPLIDLPLPLKSWFGQKPADTDVDLVLRPEAAVAMSSIPAPKTKICLLVGPEGGFSNSEYDAAAVAGFKAVSLGPRILRTETAAVAALAIAQALWGDL